MRSSHSRLATTIIACLCVAAACTSAATPAPVVTATPPTSPTSAPPSPTPTATPKAVAGWPSISRAGITMTGVDEHLRKGPEMDGRLRLSITVNGLKPGEAVSLDATGKYAVKWVCGVEPEPCGDIGCAPTFWGDSDGTARTTAKGVAAEDGSAVFRIKLRAAPPAKTCPTRFHGAMADDG